MIKIQGEIVAMDGRYFFLCILFLAHCSPQQPHTLAMMRTLKAACAPQSSDIALLRHVQKNNPPPIKSPHQIPSFLEKLQKKRIEQEKTVFGVSEKCKLVKINVQSFTVCELIEA